MTAGMLAVTSCSDFNDYNEVPVDQHVTGSQTLWENILKNEQQLSDFADLVKKTGFDSVLNAPRSLTVWAPLNGTFDKAAYDTLSKEDLLTQFVKAHVADYSHSATGKVDERVHMFNEKMFKFEGEGTYTFDGINVSTANLPSTNGLMHLIDGAAKYLPNLYEYLKVGSDIDSLCNHFMRYETKKLDEEASVKGAMVDGIQTWEDSVMIVSNELVNQLNARLTNEDSTYTFLMPTNKAFMEMYNRVKPFYNYYGTTLMHDVENYTSASGTNTKSQTVAAAYMTDSLVRRTIIRNLIYSNNDTYNQWIVGEGESMDTIRTTTRRKFSNTKAIMEENLVGQPVTTSNGYARIVDSLAFFPWETYNPEFEFSPLRNLANLFPAASSMSRVTVHQVDSLGNPAPMKWLLGPETEQTSYTYGKISAGGDRTKPDFFIALPEVMSTTYNIYVVFLPTAWSAFGNDSRPNWLNFQMNYCDAKGKLQVHNFSKAYADSLRTGGKLPNVPAAVSGTTAFTNNPEKVDTMFIGQFTFPITYSGLEVYPSLHISSPISSLNATHLKTYNRDVSIAAILLRPVELEEYEAKNK